MLVCWCAGVLTTQLCDFVICCWFLPPLLKEMLIWIDKGSSEVYLMMDCGVAGYTAATAVLDASPDSVKWEEYMKPMMFTGSGDE